MRALDGEVALITGASRGIGLATAVELARAGARVAIAHHPAMDPAQIRVAEERIAAIGPDSVGVFADISDPDQAKTMVSQVVERWGRIGILVNNAGIIRDRTLRKMSVEEWREVIDVDLSGAFYCTSAALPFMVEQHYGRIVNVSSIVAQTGNFGQTNYAAAKAGIIGFTRSAALELARYNITVNAICPGFTETGMLASVPEEVREKIRLRVPLGRFAQPEEIAEAIVFLARSDYITGQQLNVNGGLHM